MSKKNKILTAIKNTFPNSKIPKNIDNLKMGDLKKWDSLGNFNLLLEIEKYLNVELIQTHLIESNQ